MRHCIVAAIQSRRQPNALRRLCDWKGGLNLQFCDIDSRRMTVHVLRGKGAKDRLLPLPVSTVQVLRNYWRQHRNAQLIFPANGRNRKSATRSVNSMNALEHSD